MAKRKSQDDTPRKFKQMMERMQPRSSTNTPSKPKPKSMKREDKAKPATEPAAPRLERRRGESMAEFSRRVDQAIPLPRARGTDSRKTVKNTKKFKAKAENLRAEYHQRWEAKKRRLEEAEDDRLDVEDDGEDVWASINAKARRPKFGEQADRPPELPAMKPKSSIPKSAGSLARRQMLEEERARFIEEYRKLRTPDKAPTKADESEEFEES